MLTGNGTKYSSNYFEEFRENNIAVTIATIIFSLIGGKLCCKKIKMKMGE